MSGDMIYIITVNTPSGVYKTAATTKYKAGIKAMEIMDKTLKSSLNSKRLKKTLAWWLEQPYNDTAWRPFPDSLDRLTITYARLD